MENSKEQGKKKIQDEDLAVASGGGCGAGCEKHRTCMECKDRSCNYTEDWDGDYMNGKFYKCPQCGKMTFHGAIPIG